MPLTLRNHFAEQFRNGDARRFERLCGIVIDGRPLGNPRGGFDSRWRYQPCQPELVEGPVFTGLFLFYRLTSTRTSTCERAIYLFQCSNRVESNHMSIDSEGRALFGVPEYLRGGRRISARAENECGRCLSQDRACA